MTPLAATTAALGILLLGACSTGDPEPGGTPSSSARSSAPSSAPAADARRDPIRFGEQGTSCFEVRPGSLLNIEWMQVSRPVTLTGIGLVDDVGLEVGRAFVAPRPPDQVVSTGNLSGDRPLRRHWDNTNWRERAPLEGAELTTGEWYVFYTHEVSSPGRHDGMTLRWSDGAATGSSTLDAPTTVQRRCR